MVPVAARQPAAPVWSLTRFEGHSATESVRLIIREAIVDGRIPPGEQLRESRLVEMLGISRGTVREAVRQLVQEGLVEYRMHYGAFVKAQMLEDRLDVYVAREAIEVWAARTLIGGSERLTRAHETFADETRILLRRHPPYPWRTYAQDHQQLIDALRRRDPNTPELVAQHLRLSARLLAGNHADDTEEGPAIAD